MNCFYSSLYCFSNSIKWKVISKVTKLLVLNDNQVGKGFILKIQKFSSVTRHFPFSYSFISSEFGNPPSPKNINQKGERNSQQLAIAVAGLCQTFFWHRRCSSSHISQRSRVSQKKQKYEFWYITLTIALGLICYMSHQNNFQHYRPVKTS